MKGKCEAVNKVVTKKFPKEQLKSMLWDDSDGLEVIEENIIDTRRWSIDYEAVFKDLATNLLYSVRFSRGATECQDEQPFEYEDDEIECTQVEAVEVKLIKFKPVMQ